MDINELVIYRNLEHRELLERVVCPIGYASRKERPNTLYRGGRLVELAASYDLEGNLWHCFLAFCLVNNENAYTTTCEITGAVNSSLDELAREDSGVFRTLFDYDTLRPGPSGMWRQFSAYKPAGEGNRVFNKRTKDHIMNLATQLEESGDAEGFRNHVTEFYRKFGVGKFGLNRALRIMEKDEGWAILIGPIINVEHVYFKSTMGYELQKQKLIKNTEAFVEGRETSDMLLSGDAGTGRSSSAKAAFSEYYFGGLRIIEVYKYQFKVLSGVLKRIKDRNYKFIVYIDDLSFEDYRLEYRHLKAILGGGLGERPGNVLMYATSDRRHLIRERFNDKRELDDGLHNNDTVQEELSLASRFRITIYFGSPDERQFGTIMKALTDRCHLDMLEDELYREANKWELNHGGLLGCTISRFITHLLERQRMD